MVSLQIVVMVVIVAVAPLLVITSCFGYDSEGTRRMKGTYLTSVAS